MTNKATEDTARPTERRTHPPEAAPRRPSWRARWTARARAAQTDAALAVGARATAGSALALRAARLTSRKERDALARTLTRALRDAHDSTAWVTLRVPLNRYNVVAAEAAIEEVVVRLSGPDPVEARGVARLNRVLADGHGPFYRFGHGDLTGRLRAALAAM
jgi:hypothetical protein